jgi:hypothetical protein
MPGQSFFATDFSVEKSTSNNERPEESSTRSPSPLHASFEDHGMKPPETPSQRIAWTPHAHPKTQKGDFATPSENEERPKHRRSKSQKSSFLTLRGYDDEDDVDWWFASTACPLLAATIAPLANVLSIAALVTYWRMDVSDGQGGILPDFEGTPFKDPRWCLGINAGSLVCGFVGNIFLLFNFTGRIRYIVALPVSIVLFYLANFMVRTTFIYTSIKNKANGFSWSGSH